MPESLPASPRPKRRPGAPKGNTNAVKHGRRSRTRGQALKLMAMIQRAVPEWAADPKNMPEPMAALILALAERDNAVEQAITRRNRPQVPRNQGIIEGVQQIQASFAIHGSPLAKTSEVQQPTTINPSDLHSPRAGEGRTFAFGGGWERRDSPLKTRKTMQQSNNSDRR